MDLLWISAVDHYRKGSRTYAEWSSRMLAEHGGRIEPQLKGLWDQLQLSLTDPDFSLLTGKLIQAKLIPAGQRSPSVAGTVSVSPGPAATPTPAAQGLRDRRRGPLPPGVEPTSIDFGLTPDRLAFFEHGNAELTPSAQGWLTAVISVTAVVVAVAHYGFKGLFLGLIVWFPAVIVAVLLGEGFRWIRARFHDWRASLAADYWLYKEFLQAREQFQRFERERRQREEHEKRERQRRLEAEQRLQENWWKALDGPTFERELATLLSTRGFQVKHTGQSGDQGVDLLLVSGHKRIVVQCKAQRAYVSPGMVRDLYGTLLHHGADEAWLVATVGFHRGSREFADGKPIRLLTIREILRGSY